MVFELAPRIEAQKALLGISMESIMNCSCPCCEVHFDQKEQLKHHIDNLIIECKWASGLIRAIEEDLNKVEEELKLIDVKTDEAKPLIKEIKEHKQTEADEVKATENILFRKELLDDTKRLTDLAETRALIIQDHMARCLSWFSEIFP